MSGRRKNKRQRTLSSSREGRSNDKRTKPDDANRQTSVQRSRHRQNPSKLSLNTEATINVCDDATGGRALRPHNDGPVHSEGEDESKDDSWVPGAVSKKLRMEKSAANRLKSARFLHCTDQCMVTFFTEIKLPICLENPPMMMLCTKPHIHDDTCKVWLKRVFSSNVTRGLLKLHGRWEFHIAEKYDAERGEPKITAQDIYIELPLEPSPVPWTAQPFKEAVKGPDGRFRIPTEYKPDRNIREAWWWVRDRLTSKRLLPQKFPLEWTIEDASVPNVRPELPEAFVKLLKQRGPVRETPPSPFSSSSLAVTPVKRRGADSNVSLRQVKPLQLSIIQEQAETSFTSPEETKENEAIAYTQQPPSANFELPRFDLDLSHASIRIGVNVGAEGDDADHRTSRNTPSSGDRQIVTLDPPPKPEHELAYTLMQKHKLQYTEEDALCLAQYVEEERRKFDINTSKRKLCKFLASTTVENTKPKFVYVPRAEIERADDLEHCGNTAKTENAVDTADNAMELNLRWLDFKGIDESNLKGQNPTSELSMERRVGHLFDGLFRFDELQESANKTAEFLSYFQLFNTSPRPDYAVRPAPGEWAHWPDNLRPILASGDGKADDNDKDSEAQIACNSRPLIILQILIYLDTRQTADAPLPGWMFNFSWIYTKEGFIIYVHYPSVQLSEDGKDWSWKMVSVLLTDEYAHVWDPLYSSISLYHRAKAAVDIMVSHTNFILNQVRKWSHSRGQYGDGSIMNQLIARAHYEDGNDEWLHEKVREEQEKRKKR